MPADPVVAVVGPGGSDVEPKLLRAAYDVGRGVAAAGLTIVTGGLDGVMAAASRGARDGGGQVIAVLPGDDPTAANEWASVVVPTGLGELRNGVLVRMASAIVAIGGSWGTLSEVALAMRGGKPVVSLSGWQVDGPDAAERAGLQIVESAAAAVDATLALVRDAQPIRCT